MHRIIAGIIAGAAFCMNATAQKPEHTKAVLDAQNKAAYAVNEKTNGCPFVDRDMFGWPKELVKYCEYAKRDKNLGHDRHAAAYLLDVKPEVIARWIESACSHLVNEPPGCFDKALTKGESNSGYMFAIGGNIRLEKPAAMAESGPEG
jgi:hypothetical protein